jgi:hypothetical protein
VVGRARVRPQHPRLEMEGRATDRRLPCGAMEAKPLEFAFAHPILWRLVLGHVWQLEGHHL